MAPAAEHESGRAGVRAANYWRGPVWPVINWLLRQSLSQLGDGGRADELRRDSLSQITAAGEFAEYFEPFTGKPLGSSQQSWTAAVALDWSAADHGSHRAERPNDRQPSSATKIANRR
jgi:glycogen debranching enzyme